MWPDRVSNPEPLTYESDALPTALHGPAALQYYYILLLHVLFFFCPDNLEKNTMKTSISRVWLRCFSLHSLTCHLSPSSCVLHAFLLYFALAL